MVNKKNNTMGFLGDFKKGWNKVMKPVSSIPIVGEMYKPLVMHKGGRVPKTGEYRLKGGEMVLNKTQQARLKKAKTAKTKQKIINNVKKRKPKKLKARKRK
jgi:hypothetical protein